ncbi:MAG: hypothetical protein JRN10_01050 [Nitrososphaerota archaeon]|nr:hypothetical protein [Nitrososphaerota archaeon]
MNVKLEAAPALRDMNTADTMAIIQAAENKEGGMDVLIMPPRAAPPEPSIIS